MLSLAKGVDVMQGIDCVRPQRIAVVGSGAAGLTATHLLQQKHQVTLFESADRLGGHTNTITLTEGPDAGLSIDTGFIVMNHRNYPLLTRLFEQLGVHLQDSDMSFGYYDKISDLQYCGSGIQGLFAQRRNIIRPRFYHLNREINRFFKTATLDIEKGLDPSESLGDYLTRNHFSQDFIDHHLIPMGSAIWSTPCNEMLFFPAQNFMRFFQNHGLLGIQNRPQWRTVCGGSRTYIDKMRQEWRHVSVITRRISLQLYVTKSVIVDYNGRREEFDVGSCNACQPF